jgi:hypothetical protein
MPTYIYDPLPHSWGAREHQYMYARSRSVEVMNKKAQRRLAGIWVDRWHSVLGNPFIEGRDGDREEVVALYRTWLRRQWKLGGKVKEALMQLVEFQGPLKLLCWCKPLPCHADVLADAIVKIRASR